MKKLLLIALFVVSFSGLFAQQKDEIKLQKADESGYLRVDKSPEMIKAPVPVYPTKAKMQAIEGKVFLKLLIDEKGNVVKSKIDRGVNPLLDKAALEAAKGAKFSPALIKDKPVKVWVVLPIAFKLDMDSSEKEKMPGMNEFTKVDKYPELVHAEKPVYPEEAKKNKIEGKVYVKVLVDKDGSVKKTVIIKSDNEIFNQPAIDATMKSTFTPALLNKEPLAVWVVLPYRFTLDKEVDGSGK
jgi:TonB family protein